MNMVTGFDKEIRKEGNNLYESLLINDFDKIKAHTTMT